MAIEVDTEAPTITREELVARAAKLVPGLKKRALTTEQLRRIPDETLAELRAAGLLHIGNPRRFGGYGHDYNVNFDIVMELGRACGSTAWCDSVWNAHSWIVGQFSLEAQEEYYATGPDVLSSTSLRPRGKAEAVTGGYRLSGRWDFSSGCDPATWVLLGAHGPEEPLVVLIPRGDFQIVDTWHVSGLRGTGSKDIVVNDAFVPAHRVERTNGPSYGGGDEANGWRIHNRASYRLPRLSLFGHTLAAPVVGIALGAVEEFTTRLKGTSGPGRSADSVAVQLRLAESAVEAETSRLLVRHNSADMIARAAAGDSFTELDRVRYRRDLSFLTQLSLRAVNRLFEAAGGHALFDSDPLQRFHRDAHAGSHQGGLYWDAAGEAFGRVALELPVP